LGLTSGREVAELEKKNSPLGNAKWLRVSRDCNGDYHSYKEIELRIRKEKESLKSSRRKVYK
jgi:hypothetical protein